MKPIEASKQNHRGGPDGFETIEEFETSLEQSAGSHRVWLHFDSPQLEAEFLRDIERVNTDLVINTYPIGVLAYLILLIGERQNILSHLPDGIATLLIGSTLLNAFTPIGARFLPSVRRLLPVLVPIILAVNSAAHIAALVVLPIFQTRIPYSLLLIHLTFIMLLSGLSLRVATGLGSAFVAGCAVASWFVDPANLIFQHVFVLFACLLLGVVAHYRFERLLRIAWLAIRRIREMAEHDQLTGLYNRRFLDQHGTLLLWQAQRERKPVAALFIDVDWFKFYNDSLGHPRGDDALRRVSEALNNTARRPLDMACRAGGEEFTLLLYDCDLQAALERAEQLRRHIVSLQIHHPRSPLNRLTVSIGVATAPPADDLDHLLSSADEAVYAAKHAGRNCVRTPPLAVLRAS